MKHLQTGGVCIFVRKVLNFNKVDISHTCRDKDLKVCAVELEIEASKLIVLCRWDTNTLTARLPHKPFLALFRALLNTSPLVAR